MSALLSGAIRCVEKQISTLKAKSAQQVEQFLCQMSFSFFTMTSAFSEIGKHFGRLRLYNNWKHGIIPLCC